MSGHAIDYGSLLTLDSLTIKLSKRECHHTAKLIIWQIRSFYYNMPQDDNTTVNLWKAMKGQGWGDDLVAKPLDGVLDPLQRLDQEGARAGEVDTHKALTLRAKHEAIIQVEAGFVEHQAL